MKIKLHRVQYADNVIQNSKQVKLFIGGYMIGLQAICR